MTHHMYHVKEFVILKKKESLQSSFLSTSTIKLRVTRIIHLVALNTKLKTIRGNRERSLNIAYLSLLPHMWRTYRERERRIQKKFI